MGRFFAAVGEESLWAVRRLEELVETYPLRGLKGPVGTQKELLDLFDYSAWPNSKDVRP